MFKCIRQDFQVTICQQVYKDFVLFFKYLHRTNNNDELKRNQQDIKLFRNFYCLDSVSVCSLYTAMARKKLNSASKKNNIEKSSAKDEPKIVKKKVKEENAIVKVERQRISNLDFKHLRICLQLVLNKISSLMLPLIKNCRGDKVI